MKICPSCNIEYNDDVRFCGHCGLPLIPKIEKPFCPHCGKELDNEYSFCPYCGKSISDSTNTQTNDTESQKVNKVYGIVKPVPNKVVYGIARPVQQQESKPSTGKIILSIIIGIIGIFSAFLITSPIKEALYGDPIKRMPRGFTSDIVATIVILIIITAICCIVVEKIHKKWGKYLALITIEAASVTFTRLIGVAGVVVVVIIATYLEWKLYKKNNQVTSKTSNLNTKIQGPHDKRATILTVILGSIFVLILGMGLYASSDFNKPPEVEPTWKSLFDTEDGTRVYFNTETIRLFKDAKHPELGTIADVELRFELSDAQIKEFKSTAPKNTAILEINDQFALNNLAKIKYISTSYLTKDNNLIEKENFNGNWEPRTTSHNEEAIRDYINKNRDKYLIK